MKLDLKLIMKEAKEDYKQECRLNKVIESFDKILLDTLVSFKNKDIEELLITDKNYYSYKLNTKSKRYNFTIEKREYINSDYIEFVLMCNDIENKQYDDLVSIKINSNGVYRLESYLYHDLINFYELLLEEYNK